LDYFNDHYNSIVYFVLIKKILEVRYYIIYSFLRIKRFNSIDIPSSVAHLAGASSLFCKQSTPFSLLRDSPTILFFYTSFDWSTSYTVFFFLWHLQPSSDIDLRSINKRTILPLVPELPGRYFALGSSSSFLLYILRCIDHCGTPVGPFFHLLRAVQPLGPKIKLLGTTFC